MRLPVSKYPLLKLAQQSSHPQAVQEAIDKGVINFFLEAWICYASRELEEKNMLDGVSPVGALDLGRKIFENIETDFKDQDKSQRLEKDGI